MKPCSHLQSLAIASLLLFAAGAHDSRAAKWPDIIPAELAETKGRIDPEAGAEVLHYDVSIDHSDFWHPVEEHYFRIRVFNERGIEELSKVEIPYERSTTIKGVAARTIRADGSVIELGRRDIRDQEIVKAGNLRVRVKSFVPAGLEPGVILEYSYTKEPVPGDILTWVVMQRPFPVRKVTCRVEGLAHPTFGMRALFFHCPNQDLKKDKMGGYLLEMSNFAARKDEPFSPPEIQSFASVLFYYENMENTDRDNFWAREARLLMKETKKIIKPAKAVAAAAARIADPADAPAVKLEKFYDYCRTQVTNRGRDTIAYTSEERRKLPTNKTPSDTLTNGGGTPEDINLLFAALAATTGFDTRLALVNDRSVMFVDQDFAEPFSITHKVVAVRVDGELKFFDPGATYLPYGVLAWQNTDTCYVLADEKGGKFEMLTGAPSRISVRRRTANLTLDKEGTLEGKVQVEYAGLWSAGVKNDLDNRSQEERIESVRDEIRDFLPRAEITDVRIVDAEHPVEPVKISYNVRVPDFAERTGSRLFVQPAIFQRGKEPMFTAPKREASIIFQYRYTEEDSIRILMPEGFSIEEGSSPQSLDLGPIGFYSVMLGTTRDGKTLAYKRSFRLDVIGFIAKHYEFIRDTFERIHGEDNHLVTLKRAEEEPAAVKTE